MSDSGDKANFAVNPDSGLERSSISESEAITEILKSSKTIAVVGLSNRHMRPSYGVAHYLQSVGYQVFPVNPNQTEVLGEKSCARLQNVPVPVDIVDIFRRPEFVPEIVEAAIQIGARCVWMQEGVVHAEAAERARLAGLFVVMDKCMMKEHNRRARELQTRTKSS
jgi:predicted CoA-binding protein